MYMYTHTKQRHEMVAFISVLEDDAEIDNTVQLCFTK
jgi:hypothetical protein